MIVSLKKAGLRERFVAAALIGAAALWGSPAQAQTCLTSSQTGTNNGYYFSFWKDSGGSVNFCKQPDGRYTSQLERHQQLGGRQGLADGLAPRRELLRHIQLARQRVPDALWMDHQSAHRVLHRRQLGHLSTAGRTGVHGHGDQRRWHLRRVSHAARESAFHHRQRDVLPILERAAAEADRRNDHHRQPLRRVGCVRHEPRQSQLPDHGHRGISEQRQLGHHGRRRQQQSSSAAVAAAQQRAAAAAPRASPFVRAARPAESPSRCVSTTRTCRPGRSARACRTTRRRPR